MALVTVGSGNDLFRLDHPLQNSRHMNQDKQSFENAYTKFRCVPGRKESVAWLESKNIITVYSV